MSEKQIPWGIHSIFGMFAPPSQAGMQMPDGRWVVAVGAPYTGHRIRAAWWVLTGRAFAVVWPEAGDLEMILNDRSPPRLANITQRNKNRSGY